MRKTIGALLGVLLWVAPGWAMQFDAKEKLLLERGEIIPENWYGLGETINFYAHGLQDVCMLGSRIYAWGKVEQDLNVMGFEVEIRGRIGEDVRAVAGQLDVSAIVLKSALLVANQVDVKKNTIVQGEMVISGQEIVMSGMIEGPLLIYGKNVVVHGVINSDLTVSANSLVLGSRAKIMGNLKYSSPQQMRMEPGAYVQGRVDWQATQTHSETQAWPFGFQNWVFSGKLFYRFTLFLGLLCLGAMLIWLVPDSARRYATVIRYKFWPSFGWGSLTLLGIPLLILIFLITVLGIPLALVISVFYLAGLVLSHLGVGYLIGRMILKSEARETWPQIGAFALGFTVLSLVILIPYLGQVVQFTAFILGLGALWLTRGFQVSEPAIQPVSAGVAQLEAEKTPAAPAQAQPLPRESQAKARPAHGQAEWKPEVPAFIRSRRQSKKKIQPPAQRTLSTKKTKNRIKTKAAGSAKKKSRGLHPSPRTSKPSKR